MAFLGRLKYRGCKFQAKKKGTSGITMFRVNERADACMLYVNEENYARMHKCRYAQGFVCLCARS